MKKLWLVVALVALGGLTSKTFADVQNIRLSGDIRIRGYFLDSAGNDGSGPLDPQVKGNASFISQRTRVSVEADLEDHVLVVVTLKAEGTWGGNDNTEPGEGGVQGASGAGSAGANGPINRGFGVGIDEAYVQFNELFYTPATLKLGRQYLQYGRGLILSSVEQEYNYDAARLVLDYYPLTIDIVGAQLVNNQAFSANPHSTAATPGASDLLFVNARYELSDSAIKDVEAYFGWVSQGSSGPITSSRVPPSVNGSSPLIIGARTDINPTEGLQLWAEGAYEFGDNSDAGANNLSAFLFNAGGKYTLKNVQWVPVLNGNYIFASGGGKNNVDGTFIPWFDYADGYNGYLFAPALTDIHIFNLGASVKPYENTTLALQAYYYLKADKDGVAGSNPNVDFGGISPAPTANSRDIGWEIDAILGYDYSKDVRAQLVYAAFVPEGAYRHAGTSAVAEEVRAEVNVKF
ncbi:MAG TPA: alginate export family protein [Verrucomicrobiae bacterium]|nr:alginate export family protein [Verrucomicrobiae bacterium]